MIPRKNRYPNAKSIGWLKIVFWVFIISISAFWYLGLLEPLKQTLGSESFTFKLGERSLSAYLVLKALFILVTLLWLSRKISNFIEAILRKSRYIMPWNRALSVKMINIILYCISPIIALYILGFDVTTLTVFGGAVGIGIGFGLQKIASNFISGIILLFEKTINEGDLVELVGGGFGFVREISARYTLIETLDTKEVMVPNEDFITTRVTNWTLSNNTGRVAVDVRISFDSDPIKAKEIMYDIINNHKLRSPLKVPECHLLKLGDFGYEFKVFLWVDDIAEYFYSATDDIIFQILTRFKAAGIKIAYPQQDIYLKNHGSLDAKI
jgi:small-conductance mechanosensitive channel